MLGRNCTRGIRSVVLAAGLAMVATPALADDYFTKIPAATAESVMVRVLQERGLAPPADGGLSYSDYIQSNGGQDGARRVWVSLGPEGNIIPGSVWRDGHAEYCKQRARETLAEMRQLRFRLTRLEETHDGRTRYQYFVFGGVVEGSSGIVSHQQEWDASVVLDSDAASGVRAGPDAEMLYRLVSEAMDGMPSRPGGMVGPCGDIRLEHVSGSQVQEPIVFQAGYQGSYGRYLNYTWDFGDGSAPEDIGKRARHVYDRSGTYAVTVRVEGEHIEPGSRTIEVVIGGDLALHFSSRIQLTAPEGTRVVSQFESVVPLSMSADGVLTGSAPIRNVEFSHSMADMLRSRLGCSVSTRDGVLDVRATLPDADGPADAPDVSLSMLRGRTMPLMQAVPGAEINCPGAQGGGFAAMMGKVISGAGMTWWTGFVALHEDATHPDGTFRFSDWDTPADPAVIARKDYRRSLTFEGPSTFSEVTTMEIRR